LYATGANYLPVISKWFGSDPGDMSELLKNHPKMMFPIKNGIKKEDTKPASSFFWSV
jgi:hypothetical protein